MENEEEENTGFRKIEKHSENTTTFSFASRLLIYVKYECGWCFGVAGDAQTQVQSAGESLLQCPPLLATSSRSPPLSATAAIDRQSTITWNALVRTVGTRQTMLLQTSGECAAAAHCSSFASSAGAPPSPPPPPSATAAIDRQSLVTCSALERTLGTTQTMLLQTSRTIRRASRSEPHIPPSGIGSECSSVNQSTQTCRPSINTHVAVS